MHKGLLIDGPLNFFFVFFVLVDCKPEDGYKCWKYLLHGNLWEFFVKGFSSETDQTMTSKLYINDHCFVVLLVEEKS
jgi:hypothetical protein